MKHRRIKSAILFCDLLTVVLKIFADGLFVCFERYGLCSSRFLIQECALLKYRLDYLDDSQREQFMNENQLHFDIVGDREKDLLKDKLMGLAGVNESSVFIRTTYYRYLLCCELPHPQIIISFGRIPFVQALSLIGGRQVYLQDGFAYVPLQRVVSIIVTRVRGCSCACLSKYYYYYVVV